LPGTGAQKSAAPVDGKTLLPVVEARLQKYQGSLLSAILRAAEKILALIVCQRLAVSARFDDISEFLEERTNWRTDVLYVYSKNGRVSYVTF
jgi:hypothetical protein